MQYTNLLVLYEVPLKVSRATGIFLEYIYIYFPVYYIAYIQFLLHRVFFL